MTREQKIDAAVRAAMSRREMRVFLDLASRYARNYPFVCYPDVIHAVDREFARL